MCAWLQALYDLEKNVSFTSIASREWCFGALRFFFVLFHATPHALAKWGCQSADSKFWLNLLYCGAFLRSTAHMRSATWPLVAARAREEGAKSHSDYRLPIARLKRATRRWCCGNKGRLGVFFANLLCFFGKVNYTLHRALHDSPGQFFCGAGGRLPIRTRCGRVYN